MNNKKVAKGISKVINKVHGIGDSSPLVEGVDYTTGSGEEIKKVNNIEPVKKKPNKQVIDRLLVEGNLDEILKLTDNDIDSLTPEQQKKFKEWSKIESDLKLQEMANKVSSQPGYQEFMTLPLLASIMKPNPARQQAKTGQSLFDAINTTPNKPKEEQVEVSPKKDPERTKITAASAQHIRIGDSEADVLTKMFAFMQKSQKWHDKKENEDKKYRKQLDKQKDRFLDETIEALTGKKVSTMTKIARTIRKSGFLKTAAKVALGIGGLLVAKDALSNIKWKEKFDDTFKDLKFDFPDLDFFTKKYSDDEKGARKSIEDYLGREISDKELDELIRATSAEAGVKSNKVEQSMIMGTILNRARDSKKTITEILNEKNQFQAVTGTKLKPGPSEQYIKGPSDERRADILSGAATILPQVSKKQKRFTAESEAAYVPGTDISAREKLKESGGDVVGGTRFETKAPSVPITSLSKIEKKDITSSFGKRLFGGMFQDHSGVDIRGKTGDAVVASQNGKISIVDFSKSYGNYIEIDHGGGFKTRYAHLSKTNVKVGDTVSSGEKIGEVGSTGHSTGPHLHYELFKDGKKVDVTKSDTFNLNPVVSDYKLSSSDTIYRDTLNMKKTKKIASTTIFNNNTNLISGGTTYQIAQQIQSTYSPAMEKQFFG